MTVIDEEDDDTWVNVVINIEEGSLGDENPPFKSSSPEKPEIPRKPKNAPLPEVNRRSDQNGLTNGNGEAALEAKGVKRALSDDGAQPMKKVKTADSGTDDVVVIEEGGAILIDD